MGQKRFVVKKDFGSKNSCGQKRFGVKNLFRGQQIWGPQSRNGVRVCAFPKTVCVVVLSPQKTIHKAHNLTNSGFNSGLRTAKIRLHNNFTVLAIYK